MYSPQCIDFNGTYLPIKQFLEKIWYSIKKITPIIAYRNLLICKKNDAIKMQVKIPAKTS